MTASQRPALIYFLAAFAAGCIMAVMTHLNAVVAFYGSPMYASWAGHGCGTVAAVLILVFLHFRRSESEKKTPQSEKIRVPWWAYLGGVFGRGDRGVTASAGRQFAAGAFRRDRDRACQPGAVFAWLRITGGFFGLPARRLDRRDVIVVAY